MKQLSSTPETDKVAVEIDCRRASIEEKKRKLLAKKKSVADTKARLQQKKQKLVELEDVTKELKERSDRNIRLLHDLDRKFETEERNDSVEIALHDKKVELVSHVFGLFPVFPTINSTIKIVNFEIPGDENYSNLPPEDAATIASYFVKIVSLMGKYLEVALPNTVRRDPNFRWTIQSRSTGQPPEAPQLPLHPRTGGADAYKAAMDLLAQNVVQLLFDQGMIVKRGHEKEIAQNLFHLISYTERERRIGLGWSGPWDPSERLVVKRGDSKDEEDFVILG